MNIININDICSKGDLDELIKLQNNNYTFEYDKISINHALMNGHIHILEWLTNSGYELKYDYYYPINILSVFGNVSILELHKNYGFKFKYNNTAIIYAIYDAYYDVLKWFKNNNYKTKLNYIKQYKH
jgi:hypothetical protein